MSLDPTMAPEHSPSKLTTRMGVRRVNNLPIYLIGAVMITFLVIMVLVITDRSTRQNNPTNATPEKTAPTNGLAQALAGDRKDGIVPAESPAVLDVPPLPGNVSVPVAHIDNLDLPPIPPNGTKSLQSLQTLQPPSQGNGDAERVRMAKWQQLEEAVKAKTTVPVAVSRSTASTPARTPANRDEAMMRLAALRQQIDLQTQESTSASFRARQQQLPRTAPGADNPMAAAGSGLYADGMSTAGANKDASQFGNATAGDRWQLDAGLEPPRSPYELRAGFVVPATLISGINSDLPGQIMAQVSQNVFDTATGHHKLIPQGARLVGRYSSDVAYGQARVLVAWQRIIFPDGKAMDIGAMPGADAAGNSGFTDGTNNHYLRLFTSAFLMSGVTAGIALSQNQDSSIYGNRQTASSALSEALGQQLGQVTAQLIAKNINIAPTLEIRPGYRFNVVVTKDLTFAKPYQPFDY